MAEKLSLSTRRKKLCESTWSPFRGSCETSSMLQQDGALFCVQRIRRVEFTLFFSVYRVASLTAHKPFEKKRIKKKISNFRYFF